MSIKVKYCLVSPTTSPKFTAEVGDTVLVKSDQGHFDEVEVVSMRGDWVDCVNSAGTRFEIKTADILAVCN